ncbi:MAG TPA: LysR family transcriptional regulator [Zeimonas sp.]|nr:LysR family transcriptional regulator [Zeimonas sp.]
MNLDADDLVLFARVADAGSFSRASERCGLPKATVSRRISALEATLGERLMTRTTRQLAITEFGERILAHARRLLEETEAASALAQHRQSTPQGTLRVSLPPGFLDELDLVPFVVEFAQRHPQVRLELDISPRRVDVIAERFDLAVRVAARLPDDATLVARRLIELEQGLFASPAYLARAGRPDTPAQLAGHSALRLISSAGEPQPWRLARGGERWEGLPDGQLAVNSIGLLSTLAMHGMGIAGLSARYAAPMVAQGLFERVLPGWCLPAMTVWCVTPGRRLLPRRTSAFVSMLEASLAGPSAAADRRRSHHQENRNA